MTELQVSQNYKNMASWLHPVLKWEEKVLKDNRDRSEVGKSSQLEVLQAEAGVALRRAHQNEARIRFLENQQTPIKDGDEVSIIPAIAGG